MSFKSLIFLYLVKFSCGNEANHRYVQDENVHLYVHKVGPYANPQEVYEYYTLPYCKPLRDQSQIQYHNYTDQNTILYNKIRPNSIGDYLSGHAPSHSGHTLAFASPSHYIESCTSDHPLTDDEAGMLTRAAREQWFYQMYLDDLPVWGKVAEMIISEESKEYSGTQFDVYAYTDRRLTIYYNRDRIIKIDLISLPSSLVPIKVGKYLTFNTEIIWKITSEVFETRFNRYLDNEFFSHDIHWFSLLNNLMMVMFLVGLVTLILIRTFRKDYGKYGHNSFSSAINIAGHPDLKNDIVNESIEKFMHRK